MPNRTTQLSRLFVFVLIASLGLSFLTGLGLWHIHELREKLADLPRWTGFCQTLHGLLNPVICVLFGLLGAHIAGGWKMRANRRTGVTLAAVLGLLIATGAAIYYSDNRHLWFSVHLLCGLLLPAVLGAHWMGAKKWVRRNSGA